MNTFKKNANLGADLTEGAQEEKENDTDTDTESEDALSSIHSREDEKSQNELFKNILTHLKPGETVLKAIKRLGNSSAGGSSSAASTSGLSASQRWLKKKQPTNAAASQSVDSEKVKADKQSLETLTG